MQNCYDDEQDTESCSLLRAQLQNTLSRFLSLFFPFVGSKSSPFFFHFDGSVEIFHVRFLVCCCMILLFCRFDRSSVVFHSKPLIAAHLVFILGKSTCEYTREAQELFRSINVPFFIYNIDEHGKEGEQLLEAVKEKYKHETTVS